MPSASDGNALFSRSAKRSAPSGMSNRSLADEDAVVAVGIELEEHELVGHAEPFVDAAQRSARAELADVVDAGAEAEALSVNDWL